MFQLRYVMAELRHRLGRTVLTALGLAAGVGLVIGIVGVSQGLDDAQQKVLAPLTSIGTDILVTRVAGSSTQATESAAQRSGGQQSGAQQPGAQPNQGGLGFFAGPGGPGGPGGAGGGPAALVNSQDTAALLAENRSVVTDLAKLGKPGEKFTHDFFLAGTLISFPQEALDEVRSLDGVSSVAPGLTLLASHQTGTVPEIVSELQTGGETVEQVVRPEPMTDAEQQAYRQCIQERGAFAPGASPEPRQAPQPAQPGGAGIAQGPGRNAAFQECQPERFRQFRAQFTTPLRTIRQLIDPPSTDITTTTYTAAGVDPAHPDEGLVTTKQLRDGKWLEAGQNQLLSGAAYAERQGLKTGSTVDINGQTYTVVGIVTPTLTGHTADLYFPLDVLQKVAGKAGRVTQLLVKAKDANSVDAVARAIRGRVPGAEVVTTRELAESVTGSLADAKNVADRLGSALAVIVLVAAFVIAALLTLSSIAKRVREIGTLRAIGWSRRRVVGQIVAETAGIGVLGGALGVLVGVGTAVAVGRFSPSLTATTPGVPGAATSRFAGLFGQAQAAAQTTSIQLTVPVRPSTLLLGVALAVVGGVLAGVLGGWRAARLSPAEALGNVG